MTPQEREVITGIFDRLKPAATQARDPDAERHIAELIRTQPYAPYVMAQSLYVQEQALANMQQQVQQLQAQVQQMQQQAQAQAQAAPSGGGFLSGLFGGGAPARPQPQAAPQAAPWGGQPQGGMAMQPQQQAAPQGGPWGGAAAQPQRQGSGFLGTALTTAAGVAGGMVVGNMLMNAFSNHGSSQAGLGGFGQNAGGQSFDSGSIFPPASPSAPTYASADETGDDEDEDDDADGYDSGDDTYEA